MSGRVAVLIALLAGAITALGFAPLAAWPLGLAGLAVLLWLVSEAPGWGRAALIGWLFGTGMFAVSLNWIATAFTFQAKMPPALGWLAVVGLSLYLALFVALPAGLSALLVRTPMARAVLLAALWIPAEWLRGVALTGFAWNPAGALWLGVVGAPQVAAVVGGIGLSLMALLTATGLLWLVRGPGRPARLAGAVLVSGAALTAVIGARLVGSDSGFLGPRIAIIQPGIGQGERYDAAAAERHLATYLALTGSVLQQGEAPPPDPMEATPQPTGPTGPTGSVGAPAPGAPLTPGNGQLNNQLAAGLADPGANRTAPAPTTTATVADPTLVLWPEGAIDALIEADAATRQRIASVLRPGDLLLAGGTGIAGNAYANSLFVLDAGARIRGRYDKAHLVPLGEYVPWRWALEPLGIARLVPGEYDFAAGPGPRTLQLPGFLGVSPMICYEIAFPGAVVSRSQRPGWIANVSNDAWFGSWGPPQHLAQARLRAIEEGLPIARATPTGISAIIDGHGRVLGRIPAGVSDSLLARLPPPLPETLFSRFGAIPALVGALLLAIAAWIGDRLLRLQAAQARMA